MIYECPQGHICFSKDSLYICGMKGCGKTTLVLSPIDIKWFYKINKTGLKPIGFTFILVYLYFNYNK